MKRLQAYKFELMPSGAQQRDMRRFAGSCRFVFNKALALQQERYAAGKNKLSYAGLCKVLTGWKQDPAMAWLSDAPSQSLQQSLKALGNAYENFFAGRAAFPSFKKKNAGNNLRIPQGFKLDQPGSRIFLAKLGWIRYRNSRGVMGEACNVTVSSNNGKWFISVQTEREVDQPRHPASGIVGVDMGIARFATLSDGSHIEPLNSFKRHEKALAKYQRRMSRKVKFSNNWKKAKARVQKIHARIANVRGDFLHKTTFTISKNHAIVCVEDLQVLNMSGSAAGTVDAPGGNVHAKAGLNKSILDQGWYEFRRQLEYKEGWLGGDVIAVPPQNTSRSCPGCGHVSAENRRTQARFECVDCGYQNNADLVGALNILARGERMLEGQDTADASAGCESTARIACEVNGAVRPSAAGTRRSDLAQAQCLRQAQ